MIIARGLVSSRQIEKSSDRNVFEPEIGDRRTNYSSQSICVLNRANPAPKVGGVVCERRPHSRPYTV
jgi:hypothetical protein